HQPLTLAVTVGTLALTFLLALVVPKGFFPQQDTGLILGISEGSPDASFLRMVDRQRALADVVLQDPDVQALASFIGADGTNPTTNSGRLNITLKPRSQRSASAAENPSPDHRRHALRRFRPAPGIDHLHAAQPVPGHPRGASRGPAGPDGLAAHLSQGADRRRSAAERVLALRAGNFSPHHQSPG